MTGLAGSAPLKLSILMPAFNEAPTVETAVAAVLAVPVEKELIIVDDGSTDGTREILSRLGREHPDINVIFHDHNQGKGAAVRTALKAAGGDVVVIQDCDMEYNPMDLVGMLDLIARGEAEVVYGTRSFTGHSSFSFWFVMGNKLVTLATNVLFDIYISDMETCYKMMRAEAAQKLRLTARGFELEPEITGGLVNLGYRIYETPVHYRARSREEGKKLTWEDGVRALWMLVKVRLQQPTVRARATR